MQLYCTYKCSSTLRVNPKDLTPRMSCSKLGQMAFELAAEAGWNGSKKPRKKLTNAYLVRGSRVLLGFKKRGFGEGKLNGFGGKVDAGETVEEAALREMQEESGVTLLDSRLVGVLLYDYPTKDSAMEVYVFRATQYEGEIIETEEMAPQWVEQNDIDYLKMWADDPFWLQRIFLDNISQVGFVGWFDFDETMSKVTRSSVIDVPLSQISL